MSSEDFFSHGIKKKGSTLINGSLIKEAAARKMKEEKDKQEMSFINAEYRKIMDKVKNIDNIVEKMEDA